MSVVARVVRMVKVQLRGSASRRVAEEGVRTRVLVAFENEYRSYREVIAAAIKVLRPHAEVATTGLETLTQEVVRFDPQVIISSRPQTAIQSPMISWVKVPTEDVTQPTEFWL